MKHILFPPWFSVYTVVALWALLALGGGLWLVVGCLKYWGLADHAADWVQAIGSFAAIFAAWYVGEVHRRHDLLRRQQEENDRRVARLMELGRQNLNRSNRLYYLALEFNKLMAAVEQAIANAEEIQYERWALQIEDLVVKLDYPIDENRDDRVSLVFNIRDQVMRLRWALTAPRVAGWYGALGYWAQKCGEVSVTLLDYSRRHVLHDQQYLDSVSPPWEDHDDDYR